MIPDISVCLERHTLSKLIKTTSLQLLDVAEDNRYYGLYFLETLHDNILTYTPINGKLSLLTCNMDEFIKLVTSEDDLPTATLPECPTELLVRTNRGFGTCIGVHIETLISLNHPDMDEELKISDTLNPDWSRYINEYNTRVHPTE